MGQNRHHWQQNFTSMPTITLNRPTKLVLKRTRSVTQSTAAQINDASIFVGEDFDLPGWD